MPSGASARFTAYGAGSTSSRFVRSLSMAQTSHPLHRRPDRNGPVRRILRSPFFKGRGAGPLTGDLRRRSSRCSPPRCATMAPARGPAALPYERNSPMKVGRNDPCHCGSGLKYKKCHLAKDEAAHAAELAAQRAAAAPVDEAAPEGEPAADAPAPSAAAARAAAPARTPNATVRAKAQAMRQPGAARRRAV
ncbi:MAG: hypothetical protein EPO40_28275 [Myxococcaceae bacterium]|nr:MAG: hypothetical protein EPO40_28275 [Myxococcaceae bacterium]